MNHWTQLTLTRRGARPAVTQYASTFTPTCHRPHPEALGAVRVITARTAEEADRRADSVRLWRARKDLGMDRPFPHHSDSTPPNWTDEEMSLRAANEDRLIVGDPISVVKDLRRISRHLGVDELMVNTPLPLLSNRIQSYCLLAEAMQEVVTSGPSPGRQR